MPAAAGACKGCQPGIDSRSDRPGWVVWPGPIASRAARRPVRLISCFGTNGYALRSERRCRSNLSSERVLINIDYVYASALPGTGTALGIFRVSELGRAMVLDWGSWPAFILSRTGQEMV